MHFPRSRSARWSDSLTDPLPIPLPKPHLRLRRPRPPLPHPHRHRRPHHPHPPPRRPPPPRPHPLQNPTHEPGAGAAARHDADPDRLRVHACVFRRLFPGDEGEEGGGVCRYGGVLRGAGGFYGEHVERGCCRGGWLTIWRLVCRFMYLCVRLDGFFHFSYGIC